MQIRMMAIVGTMLIACSPAIATAQEWTAGKHYFLVQPAQRTQTSDGKIEVAEAFSYGCPACARFHPIAEQLQARLPANAQLVYVPASFNAAESWPLFQRAFLTAQALGVLEKTHTAMLDAVWKTGELAVVDLKTGRLKQPQPTLEQVASFYQRTAGIPQQQFLNAAKSFSVESNIKRADAWMRAGRVDQTPSFVVNGKYRLHLGSAGGVEQMFELIDWLIQKESGGSSASP
ncbi:MAG: thiol:disulfide interchange protein DsbA/DsbL [Steroidobacter sp.]